MGTDLHVVYLNEVAQDGKDVGYRLTLVLSLGAQRQIHQESSCIFKGIVWELVQLLPDRLHNPGDHTLLNHHVLGLPSEREFLKRSQGVLSQVGVLFALSVKTLHEDRNDVSSLKQVGTAHIFRGKSVKEAHHEFTDA